MIIKKIFNVDSTLKSFLTNLLGTSLNALYAPQGVFWKGNRGQVEYYLGDKVYFLFYPESPILVLEQYRLCDDLFLNESNSINFNIKTSHLTELEPDFGGKGFYYRINSTKINKIEIFAYHSQQLAEDEYAEIEIRDSNGKKHYFIDIQCSFLIRFHLKNDSFNVMLENQRYFPGGNEDFTSRFRILSDKETNESIAMPQISADGVNIFYENVFTV